MNEPLKLTVEDYYEALATTVAALGGYKKVGASLRPELPADQAARWLSDCCNATRDHELKPNQLALIRRMARAADVHILAAFEMREAGYAPPTPLVIEDERAKIQIRFSKCVEMLHGLIDDAKKLGLDVQP